MKYHPVADLFPLMTAEEFAALKADIAANGQREPVWTYGGQIIDGRNRDRACRELGIDPATRAWDGKGSLVAFVVSLNLHRRHLDSSQRAMVAADMLPLLEKENKANQKAGGKRGGQTAGRGRPKPDRVPQKVAEPYRGESRDQAAKLTNTNRQYVSDAKKIKDAAPALAEKVRAGQMTIPQAKAEVRRQERREELHAKAAAAQAEPAEEQPWRLIRGECPHELTRAKVGTPRLIFADPPYNVGVDYGDGAKADRLADAEYLGWCAEWLAACRGVVADDGSLWVLIGDEYADHFGVMLRTAGFHRRAWVKWYESFGVNCSNNFNRTSRHLFYCVADPKRFVFHPDAVSRPSARQVLYNDGRAAEGGKLWDDVWAVPRLTGTCAERIPDFPTQLPLGLLRPIIGCASDPGDLVLDPFNGSGTTGVAAVGAGRRYVGVEKQERFYDLATLRMKGVSRVCETGD